MDQFDILDHIFYYCEEDYFIFRQVCRLWLDVINYFIHISDNLESIWLKTHENLVQLSKKGTFLIEKPKGTKQNIHFEPNLGIIFEVFSYHDPSQGANFLELNIVDYTGFRLKQRLLEFSSNSKIGSIKYFHANKDGTFVIVELRQYKFPWSTEYKFFIRFSDFEVEVSSIPVHQLRKQANQIFLSDAPNPYFVKIVPNNDSNSYLEFIRDHSTLPIYQVKLRFVLQFPFTINPHEPPAIVPDRVESFQTNFGKLKHLIDFGGGTFFLLKHDEKSYKATSIPCPKDQFLAFCPHRQKFIFCQSSVNQKQKLMKLIKVIDF
jgi:hypothetical protein